MAGLAFWKDTVLCFRFYPKNPLLHAFKALLVYDQISGNYRTSTSVESLLVLPASPNEPEGFGPGIRYKS